MLPALSTRSVLSDSHTTIGAPPDTNTDGARQSPPVPRTPEGSTLTNVAAALGGMQSAMLCAPFAGPGGKTLSARVSKTTASACPERLGANDGLLLPRTVEPIS